MDETITYSYIRDTVKGERKRKKPGVGISMRFVESLIVYVYLEITIEIIKKSSLF